MMFREYFHAPDYGSGTRKRGCFMVLLELDIGRYTQCLHSSISTVPCQR